LREPISFTTLVMMSMLAFSAAMCLPVNICVHHNSFSIPKSSQQYAWISRYHLRTTNSSAGPVSPSVSVTNLVWHEQHNISCLSCARNLQTTGSVMTFV
jgi:hypothetical protein